MDSAALPDIPVTVIVATRNEERRIERCLRALEGFAEIIVADSNSTDNTKRIARDCGAQVINFTWNGHYPKKRQWCLDNLSILYDFVFFVDADEIVTEALKEEIRRLDCRAAGYFVRGVYIFEGTVLRHGLRNNKLALLNRLKMEHPVIDDIGLPGMGEIEGHYQPVLKPGCRGEHTGQLKNPLLHDAYDDMAAWIARHEGYAAWEREMNERGAWPGDPRAARALRKKLFRAAPFRPTIAFLQSYVWKFGFLDGGRGFRFAQTRSAYYRMIAAASKNAESYPAASTQKTAQHK